MIYKQLQYVSSNVQNHPVLILPNILRLQWKDLSPSRSSNRFVEKGARLIMKSKGFITSNKGYLVVPNDFIEEI